MKVFVKTLKGNHFQIQVNPLDTVGDVKKNIESVQGANVYPASQQMIIYQGKALIDGTTLEENKVSENSFIVVMLLKSKSKSLSGNSSAAAAGAAMPTSKALAMPKSPVQASITSSTTVTDASPPISTPKSMPASRTLTEGSASKSLPPPKSLAETSTPNSLPAPKFLAEASTSSLKPVINASPTASMPAKLPTPKSPALDSTSPSTIETSASSCASRRTKITTPKSPAEASPSPSTTVTNTSSIAASTPKLPAPTMSSSVSESDIIDQAASNLVAPNGLENTIQHILHMGGGIWDRDTVNSALCAASNNPERAVDYLYSGIPKQAEASNVQTVGARHPTSTSSVRQQPTKPASVPSSRYDTDIFPLAFLHLGSDAAPTGALDFLRNSEQFQVLRAMVQANPQVLQPMLQDFGKQNPNLMRLILEHQTEFQRLLNEPVEGEGSILGQYSAAMPQAIQVTPAEHAAIKRLEAMGFERSTVLEAYFACNKNEELTANYLLDHMHEFEN